jgi:hypothetical protein
LHGRRFQYSATVSIETASDIYKAPIVVQKPADVRQI